MIKTLYIHEIRKCLYSLRFKVSFVIMLLVFAVGTISFVSSTKDVQSNYAKYRQVEQETLAKQASNISNVATSRRNYIIAPRNNTVVADCKESLLPNRITYNAYNVFGFDVRHDSVNPLLTRSESLSWGFIVSMFLSFITLLFAFDAVSGEKEDRTLALVFSNSVSRAAFLGSKLLSIVTIVGGMAVVGITLSLLLIAISGNVVIDVLFILETIGFLVISILFITVFSVFGLFSSVVTRYSNVSLLISLCFWLFSAVVIPNTSVFWAKKLFPIPSAKSIEQAIRQEEDDINKNAPEGSWAAMWDDPFYPKHELRATNQTNLMNAEKRQRDAYYGQMFRQFENTRSFTLLSPIAQFDYINEAFLGGGYLRFRKNWGDLHIFREQFLQWFKDIDANDSESPHWYNPYEALSTSRKPVSVEQIPQYREQIASFAERMKFIAGYLTTLILTIAILFGACFRFFVKYDVR